MMVADGVRRGGESEEVIDRRRDLECALVAVAHDAGDPFRIDDAGADHAGDLFLEGADARALGPRMVVVIDDRRRAPQMPHRRRKPAFELVVIVAVEQVVLAIVLVVQHRLDGAEPLAEHRRLGTRPGRPRHRHRSPRRDRPRRDRPSPSQPRSSIKRLEPRAIGAGLRAEDAMAGAAQGVSGRDARRFEPRAVATHRGGERIDLVRLVERRHRARRAIDEIDEIGEGVAEEARDAQGHIDPRPVENARPA